MNGTISSTNASTKRTFRSITGNSSASMTREFNLDGTWCDLTVGGTYDLSDKVSFYGDVTKTLTGDYKQDWKVNAGLRFTF